MNLRDIIQNAFLASPAGKAFCWHHVSCCQTGLAPCKLPPVSLLQRDQNDREFSAG
jgi:hypothetical protein